MIGIMPERVGLYKE